jgi:uncharacterized protein (DUF934 family)
MIPVDPRDERVVNAARHYAALRYVEQHETQHLDENQLLIACAAHLMADHQVECTYKAHAYAVSALAALQSRTQPAWIDIDCSTADVVRVVNPVSNQGACFTAAELMRLAEERVTARTGTPRPDEGRRRSRKLN